MTTRRHFLAEASFLAAGTLGPSRALLAVGPSSRQGHFFATIKSLEETAKGRLGVAFLDTASGEVLQYRQDERFAMCSTFKMLLAAVVLREADSGKESLEREVMIPATRLLSNSPVTKEHAGEELAIGELCGAIVTRSDNTAANLLLAMIGGPTAVTAFARSLGDEVTRLDRVELALNEATPGDPRDTTSPAAMVGNLRKLVLGDTLSAESREKLKTWLVGNKTGDTRLRAGLPKSWQVGDKTGSNAENTTNDIAIVFPSQHPPIIVAAYLTECSGLEEKRNAVLAEVGRTVTRAVLLP
jgi:beta-lactamase class A